MVASTPHQEFLKWYESQHGAFVRYCSSRSYGIVETEDLVQETILAILEGYHRVKDESKLMSYMIGIANNIIRNKRRRMKFNGQWDEQTFEKLQSRSPSPEIALDIHYLLKAIDQLPDKQKEALLLFEISGFSVKEISEIQQSSDSATKTRLSRARGRLKEMLSETGKSLSVSQRLLLFSSLL